MQPIAPQSIPIKTPHRSYSDFKASFRDFNALSRKSSAPICYDPLLQSPIKLATAMLSETVFEVRGHEVIEVL
jgi:hypothetical protein